MKSSKQFILTICRDLFIITLLLFIAFSFLELIKPKIVVNYLNLDVHLLLVLVLGFITIFYYPRAKTEVKANFMSLVTIALFSVLAGIIIIYLTGALGYLSILVGLAGGIICYFLIINSLTDFYDSRSNN